MPVRKWTRSELVPLLALYCQMPFGKMDERNPDVRLYATQINRTPSAVAMKLGNFASLDPFHQSRGVKGLPNTSRLDEEIWSEYYGNWEELADETPELRPEPDESATEDVLITDEVVLAKRRKHQGFFRRSVLSAYRSSCCLTGIAHPSLLRASHIIPWSDDENRRLDPSNGLCLNALHDAAFDRGLITFSDSLELVVAEDVQGEVPSHIYEIWFARKAGLRIADPERYGVDHAALDYHRTRIFQGAIAS